MNMMMAIGAMLSATARQWSGMPIVRYQAPPKPRYGSVNRHKRSAARLKARRRAKRLNHF